MEKPWHWKPLCNAQGLHSTPSVSGRYAWAQSKTPLSFEICMKNSEGAFFWKLPLFSYSDNTSPLWCWGKGKIKFSLHLADQAHQHTLLLTHWAVVMASQQPPACYSRYLCPTLHLLIIHLCLTDYTFVPHWVGKDQVNK